MGFSWLFETTDATLTPAVAEPGAASEPTYRESGVSSGPHDKGATTDERS